MLMTDEVAGLREVVIRREREIERLQDNITEWQKVYEQCDRSRDAAMEDVARLTKERDELRAALKPYVDDGFCPSCDGRSYCDTRLPHCALDAAKHAIGPHEQRARPEPTKEQTEMVKILSEPPIGECPDCGVPYAMGVHKDICPRS